nr:hypothetical protein [Picrophilus oshimae]
MESFQNPNITIAAICRERGIAVSLFYKWKDQFLDGGRKDLEGKDLDKSLVKEVESLKSIIGEMIIANEILKKLYEEEKMSSVDEMNDNGIEVKKACYYSGINRLRTITGRGMKIRKIRGILILDHSIVQ